MRVIQQDDKVTVKVNISGIKIEDVKLSVNEKLLGISIENESSDLGGEIFTQKWKKRIFYGEILLPCKILPTLPNYKYENNILNIEMKKA